MNPFRINFDPLHKPQLGLKDQLGKSILSLTPAHIADRISDGSLRLPAPPSVSADKVLPRCLTTLVTSRILGLITVFCRRHWIMLREELDRFNNILLT